MNAEEDKINQEADEAFRPHLLAYLRKKDGIPEDSYMTHWYVITASQMASNANYSAVAGCPSEGFPLAYQVGVVDYTLTQLRHEVVRDDDDD